MKVASVCLDFLNGKILGKFIRAKLLSFFHAFVLLHLSSTCLPDNPADVHGLITPKWEIKRHTFVKLQKIMCHDLLINLSKARQLMGFIITQRPLVVVIWASLFILKDWTLTSGAVILCKWCCFYFLFFLFFSIQKYQKWFIVDFSASNKIGHVLFPALTKKKKKDLISRPWLMDSWIPQCEDRGMLAQKPYVEQSRKFTFLCVKCFLIPAL